MSFYQLRILHIIGSKNSGGAELFFLRLTSALRESVDIDLVVRSGSWISRQLEEQCIPHHALWFGGPLDVVTHIQLRSIIRRLNPDLIQTWMSRPSAFLPKTKIPSIARLGGFYNSKYYKNIDHFIGNSNGVFDHLKTFNRDDAKIHYISNFVADPLENFETYRVSIRHQYGIEDSQNLVLLVGRLHQVKGFDVAIRALSLLPDNFVYLLAGSGDQEAHLRSLVHDLGLDKRVKFAGWVNQISPLFAAADAFLIPSRIEALGSVVLESWIHRVPVIATETHGPREMITHGVDGILVPVEDPEAIASALVNLSKNPDLTRRMIEAGERKLQENYSKIKIVNEYLKLYRSILNESC